MKIAGILNSDNYMEFSLRVWFDSFSTPILIEMAAVAEIKLFGKW